MGKLQDCKYKYEIGKRKGKERERERKRRRQRGRGRGKEEIGKRNRNRKGKEKETKRRRFNVDYNPEHPVSRVIVDNGLLVCQILSRLPVKSLMRFKCVSKGWKSMIEDPNFINLHLTHSQERPGLFIFLPKSSAREEDQTRDYESFMSADLSFKDKAANIHTLRKTEPFSYSEILGPITGLVCFVDHCAVRIYNVGTGEATPWIKSRVSIHVKEQNGTVCRFEEPRCYFGFDSTTKKHKALFVWREGVFKDFPVCEVLTVGDNTWRIIDEVQPYIPSGTLYIYANGSIYWYLSSHDDIKPRFEYSDGDEVIDYSNEFIMAFDFGSEKFRVIPIPKFTISNLEYGDIRFLEVDGCLAILRWRGAIVKMWIFHDHNKANGISSGRRDNWTQVSITLPTYLLRRMFFFHSVAGKDHAILETYRDDPCQKYSMYDRNVKLAEFFSYDWKEHTIQKFRINGISFIPEELPLASQTICTTLTENLLRVQ